MDDENASDDLWREVARVGERAAEIGQQAKDKLVTVQDRRKVIRLTVDGTGSVRDVELDPAWNRSLQSQSLAGEVSRLYALARERAAEAGQAVHAEANADQELPPGFSGTLEQLTSAVPGIDELRHAVMTETVEAETDRGGIVAELGLDGRLRALTIRSKYAVEADASDLGSKVCATLRTAEELAGRRRAELAAGLTGDEPLEDRLRRNADRLRRRMSELASRLP